MNDMFGRHLRSKQREKRIITAITGPALSFVGILSSSMIYYVRKKEGC